MTPQEQKAEGSNPFGDASFFRLNPSTQVMYLPSLKTRHWRVFFAL